MSIETVVSPWSSDQINSLNAFQESNFVHQFTCVNNSNHTLIANTFGLECPHCDYTQDYAYNYMLDWSWKDQENNVIKMLNL